MDWLNEESSQCLAATLAQTYRTGAQREWPLMFQRALKQSMRVEQFAAKRKLRWPWSIRSGSPSGDSEFSLDTRAEDNGAALLPDGIDLAVLLRAIERLPARRQEIFLLRAWEGMDETEIAALLHCSEDSVRTQYRRALHTLRAAWRQNARNAR